MQQNLLLTRTRNTILWNTNLVNITLFSGKNQKKHRPNFVKTVNIGGIKNEEKTFSFSKMHVIMKSVSLLSNSTFPNFTNSFNFNPHFSRT